MSTAEIERAFKAWPQVKPTLRVPHTLREYRQLVKLLERLVNKVGENEDHPLGVDHGSPWRTDRKMRGRKRD